MIGTPVLQRKPIIIQRWADESTASSIPRKDAAYILRASRKQLGRARVVRTRLNGRIEIRGYGRTMILCRL